MQPIGTIKFVQIQQESLKIGESGARIYDPSPLRIVPRLQLTADGIYGIGEDETIFLDVHNIKHPRSRNREDNFISLGFTSHYNLMRSRFGDHVTHGIAGENIIVESDALITPEQIGERLFIRNQLGQYITLDAVLPIPPCKPFSGFITRRTLSPAEMKATLQFLSNGTRGFYMRIAQDAYVQPGDTLWIEN